MTMSLLTEKEKDELFQYFHKHFGVFTGLEYIKAIELGHIQPFGYDYLILKAKQVGYENLHPLGIYLILIEALRENKLELLQAEKISLDLARGFMAFYLEEYHSELTKIYFFVNEKIFLVEKTSFFDVLKNDPHLIEAILRVKKDNFLTKVLKFIINSLQKLTN